MSSTNDPTASADTRNIDGPSRDAPSVDLAGVTRRDFVGGTLIGAGAALLNMASPGAIKKAAAQTVNRQ